MRETKGLTLVELLVVITIILILAALLVPAVIAAKNAGQARAATVKPELPYITGTIKSVEPVGRLDCGYGLVCIRFTDNRVAMFYYKAPIVFQEKSYSQIEVDSSGTIQKITVTEK